MPTSIRPASIAGHAHAEFGVPGDRRGRTDVLGRHPRNTDPAGNLCTPLVCTSVGMPRTNATDLVEHIAGRSRLRDTMPPELGGIRYLELLPPLVYVGLAHRERLPRCHRLAVRDPGELDVLVHGQVDHLAGRSGRSRQPAQCRPFIAAPEPVVEHLRVQFFSPRSGVLVPGGPQGAIGPVFYTTADGGWTWRAARQGRSLSQLAIDFVSEQTGFAWVPDADATGSSPPAMYRITDSGRTWVTFTPRLAA